MWSFRQLFLFIYLIFLGPPMYYCATENVIFEQIGLMAGSVSYLHVHIPVSVTSIEEQLRHYNDTLEERFSNTDNVLKVFKGKFTNQTSKYTGKNFVDHIKLMNNNKDIPDEQLGNVAWMWVQIAANHQQDLQDLQDHVDSLRNLLPDVNPDNSHTLNDSPLYGSVSPHSIPEPQPHPSESTTSPPPPSPTAKTWAMPRWNAIPKA